MLSLTPYGCDLKNQLRPGRHGWELHSDELRESHSMICFAKHGATSQQAPRAPAPVRTGANVGTW